MAMDRLPNEVIYEIFDHLDIDSFFALRQSNKWFCAWTNERLPILAVTVAKGTFPGQDRLLSRPPPQAADLDWLNDLRYQQLTAIIRECLAWTSHCPCNGIHPAPFPTEEETRAEITLGLRVCAGFAQLARQTYPVPLTKLFSQVSSEPCATEEAPSISIQELIRTEIDLLGRCIDYIWRLSAQELEAVRHVITVLLQTGIFRVDTAADDKGANQDNGSGDGEPGHDFPILRWVVWRLVKLGPQMLWNIWWIDRAADQPWQNAARRTLRHLDTETDRDFERVECEVFTILLDQMCWAASSSPRPPSATVPDVVEQYRKTGNVPHLRVRKLLYARVPGDSGLDSIEAAAHRKRNFADLLHEQVYVCQTFAMRGTRLSAGNKPVEEQSYTPCKHFNYARDEQTVPPGMWREAMEEWFGQDAAEWKNLPPVPKLGRDRGVISRRRGKGLQSEHEGGCNRLPEEHDPTNTYGLRRLQEQ